jgi:hypothetical protein
VSTDDDKKQEPAEHAATIKRAATKGRGVPTIVAARAAG